mgnify:CR=1 FL=1
MPISIRQAISQINTDLKSTMDTRIAPKALWVKWQGLKALLCALCLN